MAGREHGLGTLGGFENLEAALEVVRAACRGPYLGIAALFLAGALQRRDTRAALAAVALISGGIALGRIASIATDGMPVPLRVGVPGAEVLLAVCALPALRRAR